MTAGIFIRRAKSGLRLDSRSNSMRLLAACCFVLGTALFAQTPEDEIRRLLVRQQTDWNSGDIRAFMSGYEKSDTITFVGATVTRGFEKVLARYLEKYPNKSAMGELTFSGLEVKVLGTDHASVIGRFHLKRSKEAGGDATGLFTLICRKTPAGWKIILDHTS